MLSGKRDLQRGGAEQRLHQHLRLHAAGLGLEDQADLFGAFVADVAEQGQLLFLHQLGDLLDEAGFLDLVGDFGDDDLDQVPMRPFSTSHLARRRKPPRPVS